jgi:phosphohistidine phosphatase
MKFLWLIRHAKSSWNNFEQKDFDRPLNERGKKDAPVMAKRLRKEKAITIDSIVSSPAKRAITTANYFAEEFQVKKKHIIQIPTLYEPAMESFYNAIISLDDSYKCVALFSHNPGITSFANQLTNVHIDDMPTCSVFGLRVLNDEWKNFQTVEKEFWFFDYPKNFS